MELFSLFSLSRNTGFRGKPLGKQWRACNVFTWNWFHSWSKRIYWEGQSGL